MATKWEINRAVRASNLPAPSRLIMLTLSDIADAGTAEIPEKHTPSLTVLARETGLGRSTVAEHLASLEAGGWITRIRPDVAAARLRGDRTCYRLTAPEAAPAVVQEPDSPVQEMDQVVQELDGGSPGAGRGVVQELDRPSPGAGHKEKDLYNQEHQTFNNQTLFGEDEALASTKVKRAAKAKPPTNPADNADFMQWWRTYPNPQKRPRSYTLWLKVTGTVLSVADLLAHTTAFADAWKASGKEDRFCPHSTTWLGNDGWEDPLPKPVGAPPTTGHRPFQNPTDTSAYYGDL